MLAKEIVALIFLGVVAVLGFFLLRWFIRRLFVCYEEIRDCWYVARRGTLTPSEVRQEFIDTVGREPSVSEVHDLHEMIRAEHKQAIASLLTVGAEILAAGVVLHHVTHRRDL